MDKQPVGQLPDLASSNNDDEIMVITNSEYNQLKKEKISDLITDFTSTDENNALTKGTDGKMFVTDFGNASNITEGTLPVSVLPDIPKDKLPTIETADLPLSGVTADTYAYPSSVTVNAQGQVTAISEGTPSGANANTDLSNITEAAKEVIRETAGSDYQLFDLIAKDHILTEEESLGFAPLGTYVNKSVCPDFYNTCVSEKTAGTPTQTQLGGSTITTYNNANGHVFYDIADKAVVDAFYSSTGAAWLYGVDTENGRIFLPRNDWFFQSGNAANVGKFNAAGLPNITGTAKAMGYAGRNDSGALYTTGSSNEAFAGGADGRAAEIINLDASRSSAVFGKSNTVQPPSVNQIVYMVVGNTIINSDQALIDAQEAIADGLNELEDKTNEGLSSISNASNALRQTQVTNCILEVPNNIKIEIQSDGNLVLKAGSTVIIPDGFDEDGARKFVHKTIEQDVVTNNLAEQISNRDFMAIINGTGVPVIGGIEPYMLFAGDTAPTISFQYAFWYDTANNIIKLTSDTGASWSASQYSFPFCHVDITYNTSGSYYNYPKAIFNHCGFIGSVFWADEGIKYLVPNGRNDDGTLNNQIKTTDSIQIHNITTAENLNTATVAKALFFENFISWWSDFTIYKNWNKPSVDSYYRYFNAYENIWKISEGTNYYNDVNCCTFGDLYLNESCQILWFKPYSPLSLSRGANDLKIVDSYSNGTSWYRVWSDGWIEQGGRYSSVGGNGQVYITFVKNFNTTNYYINAMQLSTGTDSGTGTWSVHTISVSGFYVRNFTDATSDIGWYACGY